jgi:hypothetical protein
MSEASHWFTRAWQSVWGALHADAGQEPLRRKTRQMTNTSNGLLLLVTEPEGQDFWLRPGETVELRADVESEADDFELTEGDQEISVWPSAGMGCIGVWLHGQPLHCGHQRPTE